MIDEVVDECPAPPYYYKLADALIPPPLPSAPLNSQYGGSLLTGHDTEETDGINHKEVLIT